MSSLDAKFVSACDQVRKFTKRPPDADILVVYGLFKQATVGNTNIPKPSGGEAASKWDAWNGNKGMGENVAKEQYISKVKALSPKYA